jgi:ribosome-binding protein aMBF1 (putative translation factor)
MNNYQPISKLKKQILSDPRVKRLYDEMQPEYDLIDKIISKRIEKNLSQKDLAKKIGTGQSAISRLESGNSNPSLKFIQKVAKALDTKIVISVQ